MDRMESRMLACPCICGGCEYIYDNIEREGSNDVEYNGFWELTKKVYFSISS